MSGRRLTRFLRGYGCAGHLPPCPKSLGGREEVASGSEVRGNGAIHREKALHAPLTLPRGLVRVLRAVVQIPGLPMFDAGQHLPHGGTL